MAFSRERARCCAVCRCSCSSMPTAGYNRLIKMPSARACGRRQKSWAVHCCWHPHSTPMREFYWELRTSTDPPESLPLPGDLALFGIRVLEQIGPAAHYRDNLLGINTARVRSERRSQRLGPKP